MTKKEARAECRKKATETGYGWWSLCWNKQNGYYPAAGPCSTDTNHICYVAKSGEYKYATKENEEKHSLKGNIPFIDPRTGKRK